MDYENVTVDDLATHFDKISRQRISQILKAHEASGNTEVVDKIAAAKALLKERKYEAKRGCSVAEFEKCRHLWHTLNHRVRHVSAYVGCSVAFTSEDDFRAWASKQVGFNQPSFELDKDVLVKGNRIYSAETCVFIPQELNTLFSGCYKAKNRGQYPLGVSFNRGSGTFVAQMNKERGSLDKYLGSFRTVEEAFACYKAAKEAKIKKLAQKWRDQIDPRAFDALMARRVEWED
jgi:hypothetical protein